MSNPSVLLKIAGNEDQDQQVIDKAIAVLERNLRLNKGLPFSNPESVINFLRLKLELKEREVFSVMFLDQRHCLIEYKAMFFGTISQAEVHPREIVKEALLLNAAAVIFSHNHPSGDSEPGQSDAKLTKKLQEALNFFDIKVLDHIVIGHSESYSFVKNGFIL